MIALIVVIALILIVGFVLSIVYYFQAKQYDNFLKENSLCLIQLREINSRYNFYPYISYDQFHTYDNEKIYD